MSDPPVGQVTPFTGVSALPVGGAEQVTLLQGSSFCISDRHGDMHAQHAQGLIVRDTRVLSEWSVLVDGRPIEALAVDSSEPFDAVFVARVLPPPGRADSTLVLVRRRHVDDGMTETISLHNNAATPRSVQITLSVDADLADVFEVKDGRARARAVQRYAEHDSSIRVERGGHGVLVSSSRPVTQSAEGMAWRVSVPARGTWSVTLRVMAIIDGLALPVPQPDGRPARQLRAWQRASPLASSADAALSATLRRSVEDLGTLRIFDPRTPERSVVAAGAPWFMALFGRDSLLTSWMSLPVNAELAIDTLQTLADYQGQREQPLSEEQPGRIPHEVRFGPAAPLAFGERNAYYGTVDATPLFVALVGEVRRWGHDGPVIRALLPAVDRALEWIERYGDADGDGYVEYLRTSEHGIVNQGWKDSWDGINHADGSMAEAPIALAEVQGYAYAAYLTRADLARDLGDAAGEARWRGKAADLKAAFNRDFWLAARGWFAVGLDRDKRPIDALASNAAHCLWTGIVDEDKAAVFAQHLLSEQMFTGWGLRTLGSRMGAFNPVSYHNGSVWPHDTAICVAGLMRYGHVDLARRLGAALLVAARHFGNRLPELFCGFARGEFSGPVPYPTSCSPQAWSSAAPLLVMRALLRFDPDLTTGHVWCAPELPEQYLPFTVRDVTLGDRSISVTVDRDGVSLDGVGADDLDLVRAARPVSGARDLG